MYFPDYSGTIARIEEAMNAEQIKILKEQILALQVRLNQLELDTKKRKKPKNPAKKRKHGPNNNSDAS